MFHERVAAALWQARRDSVTVTVTVAVLAVTALVGLADEALYRAQDDGRDRVPRADAAPIVVTTPRS